MLVSRQIHFQNDADTSQKITIMPEPSGGADGGTTLIAQDELYLGSVAGEVRIGGADNSTTIGDGHINFNVASSVGQIIESLNGYLNIKSYTGAGHHLGFDAGNGFIHLYDDGTQNGFIRLDTTDQMSFHLRTYTSGDNYGIRVLDLKESDDEPVAEIFGYAEAKQVFTSRNEISKTNSATENLDWKTNQYYKITNTNNNNFAIGFTLCGGQQGVCGRGGQSAHSGY